MGDEARQWWEAHAREFQAMAPQHNVAITFHQRDMTDLSPFQELYPDWQASQQAAVESVCAAEDRHVWVATDAGVKEVMHGVKRHYPGSSAHRRG